MQDRCSQYCDLNINRSPPFTKIVNCSNSLYANIDNEVLQNLADPKSNDVQVDQSSHDTGNRFPSPNHETEDVLNLFRTNGDQNNGSICSSHVEDVPSEDADLLNWAVTHITDNQSNPSWDKQLEYIHNTVLTSFRRYKQNIEAAIMHGDNK